MTDRYHSLTVVLVRDMRDDDAKFLIDAIRQFRGVIDVTGNVVGLESHIAQTRARTDLAKKLLDVLEL